MNQSAFVVFTCNKIKMFIFSKKYKLTEYDIIERIFDGKTYRLAYHEQRGDSSCRESRKGNRKNLRSGSCKILSKRDREHVLGEN